MKIVPMRALKDTTAFEKLCKESKEPIFITKNGYGSLVAMDLALYEKILGKKIDLTQTNK